MKKYGVIILLFILAACGKALDHSEHKVSPQNTLSPQNTSQVPKPQEAKKILYYVDPMHPWYKSDKPGKAPDCGMDLTPVYEEDAAHSGTSSSKAAVKLSADKQQLIGVKTSTVESRKLTREINSSARVAFNPDLLLAQEEYLIASRAAVKNPEISSLQSGLIKSAKTRLQLLGMSLEQIESLRRSKKAQNSLTLPQSGASTWIYGAIYESDLAWVKVGQAVDVYLPNQQKIESHIDSMDPILNPNTRTLQIRVPIPSQGSSLRADMFLKMIIHADLGNALSIPDSALIDTGERKIVFVEKDPGLFEPREIQIGKRATDYLEVLSGLKEGEKVVSEGNFLLDSESSLKGMVGDSGGHSH